MMEYVFDGLENKVGKRENAGYCVLKKLSLIGSLVNRDGVVDS